MARPFLPWKYAAKVTTACKRSAKWLASADYFAAGTQVVWDVDLLDDDVIRVYRADAPGTPTIYRRGMVAEAEPAVPGWRFAVDELVGGQPVP